MCLGSKSVRLYDASADSMKGEFKHGGPVLDCCFHEESSGFSVCADNKVRRSVILFSPRSSFGSEFYC